MRPAIIVVLLTFFSLIYTPCLAQHSATSDEDVITIRAEDHSLQAPDEISSGWSTFEFVNKGEEPHLMWIPRLPEDKSLDNYMAEYVGPLTEIWHEQRDGDIDRAEAVEKFQEAVPDWWYEMQRAGGVGVVKPGHALEVTLYLEPGSYILDCYMKTEDGELHNMEGMVRELHVTEASSGLAPPDHDIEVRLSNHEMAVDGDLTSGPHTVQVHAEEFGHNVHVARLEPDTEVQDIIDWVTPFNQEQFWPPAPATFIGGIHQLPEGGKGYFTLDLEPGRYLFISQLTYDQDVWQEVTIEP